MSTAIPLAPSRSQTPSRDRSFSKMAIELYQTPPFRAEHLGSLLRPADLLKTRQQCEGGSVKQEQFTEAEDKAIGWTVDNQLKADYYAVTDGESPRDSMDY